MMLHTLIEEFLESDEDEQETAIIIVLSCINSWRHFYEVLEHMSVEGHRVDAMNSLRRICEILDNHGGSTQLEQFHSWIISSLSNSPDLTDFDLAWIKARRGVNARRMS